MIHIAFCLKDFDTVEDEGWEKVLCFKGIALVCGHQQKLTDVDVADCRNQQKLADVDVAACRNQQKILNVDVADCRW